MRASSEGYAQYRVYCRHVDQPGNINKKHRANCRFFIYTTTSKDTTNLVFPLNHLTFNIKIHIIDHGVPRLLSLADIGQIDIFYNNDEDELIHQKSGESATSSPFMIILNSTGIR